MAKKKDPAVAVLRYFETADVAQATLVLALAKEALSRRKESATTDGQTAPRVVHRSKRAPLTQPPLPGA